VEKLPGGRSRETGDIVSRVQQLANVSITNVFMFMSWRFDALPRGKIMIDRC
jgi:hypothetical protein